MLIIIISGLISRDFWCLSKQFRVFIVFDTNMYICSVASILKKYTLVVQEESTANPAEMQSSHIVTDQDKNKSNLIIISSH